MYRWISDIDFYRLTTPGMYLRGATRIGLQPVKLGRFKTFGVLTILLDTLTLSRSLKDIDSRVRLLG